MTDLAPRYWSVPLLWNSFYYAMFCCSFIIIFMFYLYIYYFCLWWSRRQKVQTEYQCNTSMGIELCVEIKIFIYYDGQLRASQLILGCTPVYTRYQDPGQALTVGSPLLSYLDVRHKGFLPLGLTLGEAWNLGPRLIKLGLLVPVKDESANTVFHSRAKHIPVEDLQDEVRVAEPVKAKLVASLEADIEDLGHKMVVHWNMTADRFLPGRQPTVQQQIPGGNQPPPPLALYGRKRPWNANQPPTRPEDVPPRTPPAPTKAAMTIREHATSTCPSVHVGSNVAFSLAPPIIGWQSTFMLGNEPFLVTSTIRNWSAGKGEGIARSLR